MASGRRTGLIIPMPQPAADGAPRSAALAPVPAPQAVPAPVPPAVAPGTPRRLELGGEIEHWLSSLAAGTMPRPPRLWFALRPADSAIEVYALAPERPPGATRSTRAGEPSGAGAPQGSGGDRSRAAARWDRWWRNPADVLRAPGTEFGESDLALLRALIGLRRTSDDAFELSGSAGAQALRALADSGRLLAAAPDGRTLSWGQPRPSALAWQTADGRSWRLVADPGPRIATLATDPVCYLDLATGAVGELRTPVSPALAAALIGGPLLTREQLSAIAPRVAAIAAAQGARIETPDLLEVVDSRASAGAGAAAQTGAAVQSGAASPRPRLACRAVHGAAVPAGRAVGNRRGRAELSFAYGEVVLSGAPPEPVVYYGDGRRLWRIERDLEAESRALARLLAAGFAPDEEQQLAWPRGRAAHAWSLQVADEQWPGLLANLLPRLRADGWEVVVKPDFPFELVEPAAWHVGARAVDAASAFEVALDVEVDGKRQPIANLVGALVERLGRAAFDALLADRTASLVLPLESRSPAPPARRGAPASATRRQAVAVPRRWLGVPVARIAPLLPLLAPLLDRAAHPESGAGQAAADGPLRLERFDLAAVLALEESGLRGPGIERWRAAARALSGLDRIPPCVPSARLRAQMRPYQVEGLSWLQFLRAQGFNGILADDMGLGKTLQTLALLLAELDAGRLLQPALIVVPTSVVRNWADEASRFAPDLRLLVLQGPDRDLRAATVAAHHLVITSYALAVRDAEALAAIEWHYLVLDESQHIKNARTQAARVLGRIPASHRLCLTGTPLENHLGELWSQFNLLMPGLLGDARAFQRHYRIPIERDGDGRRIEALRSRVRPFVLRRTKEQVAAELPPKTETVISVTLEGPQRELYDTLRATLDQRVRAAIDRRGFARSRMVVLDALLKLRQVCCDPALLRGTVGAVPSAKRAALMEWLPELVEEGRRVLVFSSFASMLDLLAADMRAAGIGFSKLTGRTRDRAEQVEAFQAGRQPVFLVSLKAGGVGLNLTAADVVILFDPWWNPAAEQQAADRAHRIGQQRPVFVYRLIAAATVEERIVQLQARKAQLTDQMLAGVASDLALDESDFAALLAPQD